MPIKPNSGENKNDFVSRCIVHEKDKGHPQDQAVAMCISIWKENLRSVVVKEDFKVENVKPWIERGYDIHVQSSRIIPVVYDELRSKLEELGLDDSVVKFDPLELLDKVNKYSAVVSDDPLLDTLMLRGTKPSKRQRVITSKEVNSIADAEAAEVELREMVEKDVQYKFAKVKVYYTYDLRQGVSGPAILPTTRNFCETLLHANNQWTLDEIKSLSNGMGLDPFVYAGGFWREKGTNITHPYCRHAWFSKAVIE